MVIIYKLKNKNLLNDFFKIKNEKKFKKNKFKKMINQIIKILINILMKLSENFLKF